MLELSFGELLFTFTNALMEIHLYITFISPHGQHSPGAAAIHHRC